jgi:hypothetical protein
MLKGREPAARRRKWSGKWQYAVFHPRECCRWSDAAALPECPAAWTYQPLTQHRHMLRRVKEGLHIRNTFNSVMDKKRRAEETKAAAARKEKNLENVRRFRKASICVLTGVV